MLTSVLSQFTGDLFWLMGNVVILILILFLFLISFFRNIRTLLWYYVALLLMAIVFVAFVRLYPSFMELLVSYRSDWSLVFLIRNISFSHLLTQFVFFFLIYGLMGVMTIVVLELWSLVTFRWSRMKNTLKRSFSEPWFVLFFSLLTILMGVVWTLFIGEVTFEILQYFFLLFSFLFLLQFFLRIIDNAYLDTPQLFSEFVFVTGLVFLLGFLLSDWLIIGSQDQLLAKDFFLQHLFLFFLVLLLLGYISTFFVRALFASGFFLQHYQKKLTIFAILSSRILLSARDRHYSYHRILLGLLFSLSVGFVFLLMLLQGYYLSLIPLFFFGYFVLFVLLDRQDDMRIKGDLVEKRIESASKKAFYG